MVRIDLSIFCCFIVFRQALASDSTLYCDYISAAKLLDCSSTNTFPDGLFEEVETAAFSGNNFTALMPYVFFHHGFRNLKRAYLSFSNISHVRPDAFALMSRMIYLDLSYNRLVSLHNNSFQGLTSLQHLNLEKNGLRIVTEEVLKPLVSLATLQLLDNSLKRLEGNLLLHAPLALLDLSRNPIQLDEEEILESSSLSTLIMRECNLTTLPKRAFSKLPNLQRLDLSANKLDKIPGSIFEAAELRYLNIDHNFITHIDLEQIYRQSRLEEVSCLENPFFDNLNCTQPLPLINAPFDISSTTKEMFRLETILYPLLIVASVICIVLLILLIYLSYYVMCMRSNSDKHIYSKITEHV